MPLGQPLIFILYNEFVSLELKRKKSCTAVKINELDHHIKKANLAMINTWNKKGKLQIKSGINSIYMNAKHAKYILLCIVLEYTHIKFQETGVTHILFRTVDASGGRGFLLERRTGFSTLRAMFYFFLALECMISLQLY